MTTTSKKAQTFDLATAWSLDELCERAGIAKSTYRHLAKTGRVPTAYKVGRRLWFRPEDAQRWLDSRVIRIDPVRVYK
jgi:predicted site-specific integrase-resolvase